MVINLEEIERKILDDYCTDESGVRPVASILDETEERSIVQVDFERYAKTGRSMQVPNSIILRILDNGLVEDASVLEDGYYEPSKKGHKIPIDYRYADRIVDIFHSMLPDVESGELSF